MEMVMALDIQDNFAETVIWFQFQLSHPHSVLILKVKKCQNRKQFFKNEKTYSPMLVNGVEALTSVYCKLSLYVGTIDQKWLQITPSCGSNEHWNFLWDLYCRRRYYKLSMLINAYRFVRLYKFPIFEGTGPVKWLRERSLYIKYLE
jgi:hypothetical protein